MIDKQNLTIRLIEYGLAHDEFTLTKVHNDLRLSESENNFMKWNLVATTEPQSNHIFASTKYQNQLGSVKYVNPNDAFRLLPNALFSYTELQEIQLARENAEFAKSSAIEANKQSMRAIKISMWALYISAGIGVLQLAVAIADYFKS